MRTQAKGIAFAANNQQLTVAEKNIIYAKNYYGLAMKYYAAEMGSDALRMFRKVLRYDSKILFTPRFLQYVLMSFVGKQRYEKIKQLLKI